MDRTSHAFGQPCRICGLDKLASNKSAHICICYYCGRERWLRPRQVSWGAIIHQCSECAIMKRSNVSAAAFVEYYRKIEDGECVWYYVERLTDNVINPVFSAYVNRVLEQTKDADPETMHAQFAEWFDYAEKKAEGSLKKVDEIEELEKVFASFEKKEKVDEIDEYVKRVLEQAKDADPEKVREEFEKYLKGFLMPPKDSFRAVLWWFGVSEEMVQSAARTAYKDK